MKLTIKVETENYDKSVIIDDKDIKVFNNKKEMLYNP